LPSLERCPENCNSPCHVASINAVSPIHSLTVCVLQDDVLIATGDLVVSLAGRKEIGRVLVASPGWLDLANTLYKQLERPRTTKFLSPAVLEKMVRNPQPVSRNQLSHIGHLGTADP
jgi:hypothetical protein